eukprot:556561_1
MASYLLYILLPLLPHFINAIESYKIGHFDETIINPTFPSHEIPVYLYYPITSNTTITFPTIIFAHGFECDAQWYSWIYKDLVPLGYIVALLNSFPFPGHLNQTQFAIDQRYTLKWLTTTVNNNKSSPLYQHIDNTKAVAAGHSEGGGASMETNGNPYVNKLFNNKYNFSAIFTMAPCGQGNTGASAENVNIPVFVFTGTMDCICPEQEAHFLYEKIPDLVCKYYSDVTNATHCHWLSENLFDNVCADAEKDLCEVLHPNDNVTISEKEQLSIGSKYLQMFLNATVVDGNNNNDFKKISAQLNTDKNDGVMTDVIISKTC